MTNDANPAIDPLTGKPLDQPDPGYMILYDAITPPLPDGVYMATATTEVDWDQSDPSPGHGRLTPQQRYFAIDGPRFTLPSDLVASVVPPRNGHGGFQDMLPHIALGRKTLPWERDPGLPLPAATSGGPPPLDDIPVPWVALLLFEEGECTLKQNEPLSAHLPHAVLAALKVDGSATADFVIAKHSLVSSIMPSVEELKLLTHCRQVNVDYKELSAGSSDGYFSIVMSNRLPEQSKKYIACLVSVEQRTDLVPTDPPAPTDVSWSTVPWTVVPVEPGVVSQGTLVASQTTAAPAVAPGQGVAVAPASLGTLRSQETVAAQSVLQSGQAAALPQVESLSIANPVAPVSPVTSGAVQRVPSVAQDHDDALILLTSWKFECSDLGTFKDLMQAVDDAMMGTVADPLHPPITDTGHLPVQLNDRAGVVEHVLYRGPLVPMALSRDDQGPYHSADQARRVMPDTGVEDISYAAAFEVGRLLAMSDGRLAQELMRWRRTAFRQAVRATLTAHLPTEVRALLPAAPVEQLATPLVPVVQSHVISTVATSGVPAANSFGMPPASAAPGLDPTQLASAWGTSVSEAQTALGRSAGIVSVGTGLAQEATAGSAMASGMSLDQLSTQDAGIAALHAFHAFHGSGVTESSGPKE